MASKKESYEVPILLEDGWTSIHLTIEHSKDESGKVRASFESDIYGKVDVCKIKRDEHYEKHHLEKNLKYNGVSHIKSEKFYTVPYVLHTCSDITPKYLDQHHRVTEGEESVSLLHSLLISGHDRLSVIKCRH